MSIGYKKIRILAVIHQSCWWKQMYQSKLMVANGRKYNLSRGGKALAHGLKNPRLKPPSDTAGPRGLNRNHNIFIWFSPTLAFSFCWLCSQADSALWCQNHDQRLQADSYSQQPQEKDTFSAFNIPTNGSGMISENSCTQPWVRVQPFLNPSRWGQSVWSHMTTLALGEGYRGSVSPRPNRLEHGCGFPRNIRWCAWPESLQMNGELQIQQTSLTAEALN